MSTPPNKFERFGIDGDGACLFGSFLYVMMPLLREIFGDFSFVQLWSALIDDLRIRVADYIYNHPETHGEELKSQDRYANIKDYCSAIITGDLWGGDPELKVLAILYNIVICVIDPTRINGDNHLVPSYYGQNNRFATDCVYIYFNGRDHFDALIMKIAGTNRMRTRFRRNDPEVKDPLQKFISDIQKHALKAKIKSLASNLSIKRKQSDIDSVVPPPNDDKQIPVLIDHDYYNTNKRIKITTESADESTRARKNNSDSAVNMLIQDGTNDQPTILNHPIVQDDQPQQEPVKEENKDDNKSTDDL